MKRYGLILFLIFVSIAMFLFSEKGIGKIKGMFSKENNETITDTNESCTNYPEQPKLGFTVVLDAGHGGFDPGKVGVNNALEKDINLAITIRLKKLLEAKGATVVLTRDSDIGLYSDTDSNKKAADMKKRVQIIEESKPDITISIHQNSFTDSSSRGAQVFYYTNSEKSQQLANVLQETMIEKIADGNNRVAKANDSYYLLKKTSCPIAIVECGFLSNASDAALLITQEYQNKIASAICEGIITYMTTQE